MQPTNAPRSCLRAGMVGMGMIFDETYRPLFESLHAHGLYPQGLRIRERRRSQSVATRTGTRARAYKERAGGRIADFTSFDGSRTVSSVPSTLASTSSASPRPTTGISRAAKQAIDAGKHVLIEKPVGARLGQLDELVALARQKRVLAKVVYHKLSTPTTRSCARSSPMASSSTSTTATARCWSRRASAAASSPSGSRAAIPAPMSPCITSSSSTSRSADG